MTSNWIYRDHTGDSGPVDSRRLKELAAAGTIRPDTLVRRDDDGQEWVRADRVNGLFDGVLPAEVPLGPPAVRKRPPPREPPTVPTGPPPDGTSDAQQLAAAIKPRPEPVLIRWSMPKDYYRSARYIANAFRIIMAASLVCALLSLLASAADGTATTSTVFLFVVPAVFEAIYQIMHLAIDVAENSWKSRDMLGALLQAIHDLGLDR